MRFNAFEIVCETGNRYQMYLKFQRVSEHDLSRLVGIFTMPVTNKLYRVDAAGIGGRMLFLPGGLSVNRTSGGSF